MTDNPLNPEVITSNVELFKVASTHHFHGIECLCGFKSARSRDRTEHIMLHTLSAAQPVVNSVEELDALPVGTVVLDAYGASVTKIDYATWVRVTPAISGGRMFHAPYLPARVLYRPEVIN